MEQASGHQQHPAWLRRLPNQLTFLRILCIPAVVVLMLPAEVVPEPPLRDLLPQDTDWWAAVLFALAAITDFFDGWLARKYQVETVLGKLLDPLADKLLVVSALIILVEKHRIPSWVAVIIVVRDLGINAIRLAALDDNIQIPSSFLGKTKTFLLDIGIIGLMIYATVYHIPFEGIGKAFMWAALFASVVSAVQYLWGYGKELKRRELL